MRKIHTLFLFFVLKFYFIFNLNAYAETICENKKFEWGAGLISIYGNHYRGSDQSKLWLLPLPYFTYKSKRLEAEPSFVRGVFYSNSWFSLKLSLMAGLKAESKENRAREGMPSLDYTLEVGPMFVFHLFKSADKTWAINFEMPIRESFATNFHYLKPIGGQAIPYLNILHAPTPSSYHWSFEFSISPMIADYKYHQYFYGVDQKYSRPDRPSYHTHGGYSGLQSGMVFNKRIDDLVIIPFVRWDYLKNAVFENSPLVKTKNYALFGLGLFWIFN